MKGSGKLGLDSAVYLPRFLEDQAQTPTDPRVRTIDAMFKHVSLTAWEIAELGRSSITQAQKDGAAITPEMIAQDQERMELRRIKLNSASNDITKLFRNGGSNGGIIFVTVQTESFFVYGCRTISDRVST